MLYFLLISASISKNFDETIIDGNQRISKNSIIMFSEIPDETDLNENNLNLILKNLFETGFFEDVNIKILNRKLIISQFIFREVFEKLRCLTRENIFYYSSYLMPCS